MKSAIHDIKGIRYAETWLIVPTLGLLLAGTAARAETCYLRLDGKEILDHLPCLVDRDYNKLTIEQGNYITIEIERGVLKSNIANKDSSTPGDPGKFRLRQVGGRRH